MSSRKLTIEQKNFGGSEHWSVEGPWIDGKPHGLYIFEAEGVRGVALFTHG